MEYRTGASKRRSHHLPNFFSWSKFSVHGVERSCSLGWVWLLLCVTKVGARLRRDNLREIVVYPGCSGFFQCCSCHRYVQEFRCLPVPWMGWPNAIASVHEVHKWNSSHPITLQKAEMMVLTLLFTLYRGPFLPLVRIFTCDLKDELTIDVRMVYLMYELFTYLLQTNNKLSFATW